MMESIAVVLAAGQGTRMESTLPKVLVEVAGRPMIEYVLDAIDRAGIDRTIVVVGYQAELVEQTLKDRKNVEFALQAERLGTGHAVMSARPNFEGHSGPIVVLTGDAPMTRSESIAALVDDYKTHRPACVLGTAHKENPYGLGRIVRDSSDQFVGIVEEKDATDEQRAITEVNMSYYVFDGERLPGVLTDLRADNKQGEYYITDCPGLFVKRGLTVRALPVLKPNEALGVNTLADLAQVERVMLEGEE